MSETKHIKNPMKGKSRKLREAAAVYGSMLACQSGDVEDEQVSIAARNLFWATAAYFHYGDRPVNGVLFDQPNTTPDDNQFVRVWGEVSSMLHNGS